VDTPSGPTEAASQVATPPEPMPRRVPDGGTTGTTQDDPAARTYATRREARAAQGDARRPAPVRRPEPPAKPARPADEAAPARTSTTTGHRLGPLGRFSWPLVALLGLLVVLLLATLLTRGGGDDDAAGAATGVSPYAVLAMAAPDSGMMLQDMPRPVRAATTEKDD
jgi:serine/threonine-protein kinase